MTTFNSEQLAQSRPAGTSAVELFSPASKPTRLDSIIIANTTAVSADFSLYIDKNGTTYDQTTAIAYQVAIAGNSIFEWVFADGNGIVLNNSTCSFAVQTSTGSSLTFTLDGEKQQVV